MKASVLLGALIAAITVPSAVSQAESSISLVAKVITVPSSTKTIYITASTESSSKSSDPPSTSSDLPSTTTESSSKIDDPTSTSSEPSSTSSDPGPTETGKGIENHDMLSKGRVDGGVTDDFYWFIQGHNATNDLRRVGAIEPIQLIIDSHDFNNCTLIVGCKKTKGSYSGLTTLEEFKRGDPWYWRPCENLGEGEMNTGYTIDYYVAYCL